ncbi:MAG: hypothetical protein V1849_02345 [Chloroflexota bacterium]
MLIKEDHRYLSARDHLRAGQVTGDGNPLQIGFGTTVQLAGSGIASGAEAF